VKGERVSKKRQQKEVKPKVEFYSECDYLGRSEWHYTVTGFPPPHERTVYSCGPFRSWLAAWRDYLEYKRGGYI